MTINIDEFRKYLEIDRSSLDDEVRRHASLLFAVSEAMVEAISKRDTIKDFLAKTEAEIDHEVRESFGDAKYTETQVKSTVLTDPSRVKINTHLLEAKAEADKLIALKDAFHTRGFMLRDLCSLYLSNYYTEDSARGTSQTDAAVYGKQRARLAEGRKNRGE